MDCFLILLEILLVRGGGAEKVNLLLPYGFVLLGMVGCAVFLWLLNKSGVIHFNQLPRDAQETKAKEPEMDYPNSHLPYVLISGNGHQILHTNEPFQRLFGPEKSAGSFKTHFPGIDLLARIQEYTLGNRIYTVNMVAGKEGIYFYFAETIHRDAAGNAPDQMIVGLVFIDNYDEVFAGLDEERKPLAVALIDRKLNSFARDVGGVIKNFEKDKYILFFSSAELEGIQVKKFDILGQVREIDMGNKIPLTLSIGLGAKGKTLNQSMDYARAAIDLALGRGGDQVVIKEGDNYTFFGGKAKDVGTNTRVRARVKAYVLGELIDECDNVIIMGHRNADLDCIGAGVGVYNIVKSLGKSCNIILNTVSSSIKGLYDKLLADEYYREDCFITSSQAFERIGGNTLLVIVDCHRPSIMECPELYEHVDKIVVFDHHRKGAEFVKNPVMTYHEPYASSTCELIVEMMQHVKHKVDMSPLTADALLAGITVDTKNFFIKTGTKTFEAAAYLRRHGADTIRVRLYTQNDMESYKAKAMAVNNTKIFRDTIAITVCTPHVENPSLLISQVADDLLNISGITASFAVCLDHAAEQVMISARSLGDIDVQRIMEKMGGGGHQTAAGTQIDSDDLEEALAALEENINEYLDN